MGRGCRVGATGPKVTSEDMAAHMRHVGELNFSVLVKMLSSLRDHRTAEFLPEITAPTLVLAGRHDLFTPPRVAEQMARVVPGAEIVWFEHAGHLLPVEEADEAARGAPSLSRRACGRPRRVRSPRRWAVAVGVGGARGPGAPHVLTKASGPPCSAASASASKDLVGGSRTGGSAVADPERNAAQTPGGRRWYRRPRRMVLLIAAAVVVGGAISFAISWSHRGADEASLDRAVERFRTSHGASTAGFLRPASGVYTFVGTGTEKLSLLATTQHWGPRIPVTVTGDTKKCWTFRVDYSTHHWQSVRYCAKGRVLHQTGETTSQTFDFVAVEVSDANETVCDPPADRVRVDAQPRTRWPVKCDGHSTSRGTRFHAAGTDTFIGIERLRIGGEVVPVYHYSVDRTLTGDQSGSEHYDMWYSVLDGLPLKTVRRVTVKSPSPIGAVTYTEKGAYTLNSLTPRR